MKLKRRIIRFIERVASREPVTVRVLRRDAELGRAYAQAALGDIYRKGTLAPKNLMEAARGYRRAAEQGDAHAQFNLGAMYSAGRGVPRDPLTAYMWFDLSVSRGIEAAAGSRKTIARQLSPHQVEQAQKLAEVWRQERQGGAAQPAAS